MKILRKFALVFLLLVLVNSPVTGAETCDTSDTRLGGNMCLYWDTLAPRILVSVLLVGPEINGAQLCEDIDAEPRSPEWSIECDRRYSDTLAVFLNEHKDEIVRILTTYELYDTVDSARRLDSSDFTLSRGYMVIAAKEAVLQLIEEPLVLRVTYMAPGGMGAIATSPLRAVVRSPARSHEVFDLRGRRLASPPAAQAAVVRLRDGVMLVGGKWFTDNF